MPDSLLENNVNVAYDNGTGPKSPWATENYHNAPYVAMTFEPIMTGASGLWATTRVINLSGAVSKDIVGDLEVVKNNIINVFSKNGGIFSFVDHYGNTMTFNNVFVDSISFPQQQYIGKLDYSISLKVYDFEDEDVLNPTDQIEVEAAQNGSISITRTVSASGVGYGDADKKGINGAKSWVDSRISNSTYNPFSIAGFANNLNYLVLEDSEVYNRLTGSYSRTLKYLADEGLANRGDGTNGQNREEYTLTKYAASVSNSISSDFTTVSITAEITGGKNTTESHFRNPITEQDPNTSPNTNANANWTETSLLNKAKEITGINNLCGPAHSINIEEDINSKSVTVKAEFDTDQCSCENNYFFDYNISVNTDYIFGITKINIEGELKVKGSRKKRNEIIDDFISATDIEAFLFNYASTAYNDTSTTNMPHPTPVSTPLNSKPESLQISKNTNKGTLTLSASFNDEDHLTGYSQVNWSAKVKGSVPYVKTAPSAKHNGHWSIQYFGFNSRELVSSSVNLISRQDPPVSESALKNNAITIQDNILDMFNPDENNANQPYTISETENFTKDSAISISLSSEKSYFEKQEPLIMLNVGPHPL